METLCGNFKSGGRRRKASTCNAGRQQNRGGERTCSAAFVRPSFGHLIDTSSHGLHGSSFETQDSYKYLQSDESLQRNVPKDAIVGLQFQLIKAGDFRCCRS